MATDFLWLSGYILERKLHTAGGYGISKRYTHGHVECCVGFLRPFDTFHIISSHSGQMLLGSAKCPLFRH